MLSIEPIPTGGDYYAYLLTEYYLGEENPGRWAGKGAEALGLAGEVDKKAFTRLLDGFDRGGKPLVQNAGDSSGLGRAPGRGELWAWLERHAAILPQTQARKHAMTLYTSDQVDIVDVAATPVLTLRHDGPPHMLSASIGRTRHAPSACA